MRVFGSSGPADITSDHLYVHTITISGFMDRRYHYMYVLGHGYELKLTQEYFIEPFIY